MEQAEVGQGANCDGIKEQGAGGWGREQEDAVGSRRHAGKGDGHGALELPSY